MRWGPADCSATLGEGLGYSFSVIVWSVFKVANYRSLALLFLKGEGEGERGGGELEFHLPEGSASHSPIPTSTSKPLLPTILDTFGVHRKWPH